MTSISCCPIKQPEVECIDAAKLSVIFMNDHIRQILFPSNCFFSYWMPYRPIPANAPLIIKDKMLFIGSDMECAEKMIISCGQWNVGHVLTSYYIDIYGNLSSRVNLRAHLIAHVNNCKTIANGIVEISVYMDEWVDLTNIYELFQEFDMEKERERLQIICECNLHAYRKL